MVTENVNIFAECISHSNTKRDAEYQIHSNLWLM